MGLRRTTLMGAAALLCAASARADAAPPPQGLTYEVAPGDTLIGIAARQGCAVADLVEWNQGLDPDRIYAGQTLWLEEPVRFTEHVIAKGETLIAIARTHQVTLAELTRWNPGLSPSRIRAGHVLKVGSRRPSSLSESVGLPHAGSLRNATRLPRHSAWLVRDPARSFGTDETVRHLREAFESLHRQHPNSPRAEVHDLSLEQGGPITDHASHQSGRDADIALITRHCTRGVCDFRRVAPGQLDAARQWTLLYHWLRREQVEAIMLDYSLQAVLYREARKRGATQAELNRWIQYPRGRSHPGGTIRHQPNHADHVHVRFACHRSDPECEPVRVVAEEARVARAAELRESEQRSF
jgi:LysM repeat protein